MKKLDRAIQSMTQKVTPKWISNRVTLGHKPLKADNAKLLCDALRASGHLCEDIAIHHFDTPTRIIPYVHNYLVAFTGNDIISIIDFFDSVRAFLVRLESPISIRLLRSRLATFAADYTISQWKGLLSPIKELVEAFCCDTVLQPRYLQDISSFLLFLKKLPFKDIGVEEKMLRDYLDVEDELSKLVLDDEIVRGVTAIITEWFKDFRISSYKPFHGNGSTALGKLTKYEKYHNLTTDNILLRCLNVDVSLTTDYFPVGMKQGLQRCSRLKFVPKTAKKLRSISMEEPSLIYFQESVRTSLEAYVKHHHVLKNVIMFGNQTRNQDLAQMGSVVRNISTIDLSSASDTVSQKLVRRLFAGVPHLYRHLQALRSHSTILPNGTIKRLEKYAPMGSALCFPVECIVFASVVQYCYRQYHGIEKNLDSKFFSVYGDDIICNDYITNDVMSTLTALGFKVNRDKSFFGSSWFRESCGREFFQGVEVTPIYYRLLPLKKNSSPEMLASLAGMTHTCETLHYDSLRAYVCRLGLRRYKYVAFTSNTFDTAKFYSVSGTNYHLKKDVVTSEKYQTNYCKYKCVLTKDDNRHLEGDDRILYFEWLRSHSGKSTASWKSILFPDASVATNLHGSSTRLGWGCIEVYA